MTRAAALSVLAATLLVLALRPDRSAAPRAHPDRGAPADPNASQAAHLLFGGRLDLRTATAEDLAALPGVGRARAEAIVHARAETPFTDVEDLLDVPGIGPKTLERLRPYVVLPPP